MNYQTELMKEILTNKKAQEIIDYVSPIYGDSYVGLWLYQVIGSVLGPIFDISANLRYETSPITTTLLLSYYEQEYGIQADTTMTLEQRRAQIIANMQSKGACNPARLANAISAALGGVPVEILEYKGQHSLAFTEIKQIVVYGEYSGNTPDPDQSITTNEIDQIVVYGIDSEESQADQSVTTGEIDQIVVYGTALDPEDYLGPNSFVVNIRQAVKSYAPAIAVIEKMKPAHLIYKIQGVTEETASTDITVATAMTRGVMYSMHVQVPETTSGLVVINDTLKRAVHNTKTGQTTYYDIPSQNDGNGTTIIDSLSSTDDGNGTVTIS